MGFIPFTFVDFIDILLVALIMAGYSIHKHKVYHPLYS